MVRAGSADLLSDLTVADDISADGRVTLSWTLGGQVLDAVSVTGVVTMMDDLDIGAFDRVPEADRVFAWRELRAYLSFALHHLPNVLNPPQGQGLSSSVRGLPHQWAVAGDGVAVPRWFPDAAMTAGARPLTPSRWRGPAGALRPADGLVVEVPAGQRVHVTIVDGRTWHWAERHPLPAAALKEVSAAALGVARSLGLRAAQLLFFLNPQPRRLTFAAAQALPPLEPIPRHLRGQVVEALVDALARGYAHRNSHVHVAPAAPRSWRTPIGPAHRLDPTGSRTTRRTPTTTPVRAPIVVIGASADPTAAHFLEQARRAGVSAVRWPAEEMADLLPHLHRLLREVRVPGIYYRRPGTDDAELERALELVEDLCDVLGRRVVGAISHRGTNFAKPLHTARIGSLPGAARAIPAQVRSVPGAATGRLVLKALSAAKAEVVTHATGSGIAHAVPAHLQERVMGRNVRVHVCGDAVSAVEVGSARLDYRFDPDFTVRAVQLPASLEQWCRTAARREGIVFAGVDLIVSGTDVRCLEVNPNPGYHVFEKPLLDEGGEAVVTRQLIRYLTGEA